MLFDDIIFIYIVFYFKNYQKKYFLSLAFFLAWRNLWQITREYACWNSLFLGKNKKIGIYCLPPNFGKMAMFYGL